MNIKYPFIHGEKTFRLRSKKPRSCESAPCNLLTQVIDNRSASVKKRTNSDWLQNKFQASHLRSDKKRTRLHSMQLTLVGNQKLHLSF